MISVGITGQSGFVGTHLYNYLQDKSSFFKCIPFEDSFFEDEKKLQSFVKKCDVIVHLAAMMRSPIEGEVYATNMRLVHKLIQAMEVENISPAIIFSSSIQEGNGSEYGRCKYEARLLLHDWTSKHNVGFAGVLFPNLFGPGAKPNSHSFVATFCYKLNHNEEPQILVDNIVPLKYIKNLLSDLSSLIQDVNNGKSVEKIEFKPDYSLRVSDVLSILKRFKQNILIDPFPSINSAMERDLFETFTSYIENNHGPKNSMD